MFAVGEKDSSSL